MKAYWSAVFCAFFIFAGLRTSNLQAQESAIQPSVLHIQQTQTTSQGSQNGFPTFLAMYHVLDGAKSPAEALSLTGTISLKNYDPTFSEVLWILTYWQGKCPAHDITLSEAAILWSDILKNPSQSDSTFTVNLVFPHPLPMTGCVGLYYGGGPLFEGKATMSADLNLAYKPVTNSNPDTVLDLSGEYCFGQDWGCQNATAIDGEGFAVPFKMQTAGHLLELFGNISDSAFDGTQNFGPLPTGESWGAGNDFYLLPGGCGIFTENLNSQGFPNPAPLSTLHNWLPHDALHLASVPLVDRISSGQTGEAALQGKVENIFSVPVTVNAGDCIVVIYGRSGNGATDNETQVHALMAP
ncbi:MAG: hypothetical protein WA741_12090 [Candidatus Sulfotelmatobacter sp.]|jgi:hypothetical protein